MRDKAILGLALTLAPAPLLAASPFDLGQLVAIVLGLGVLFWLGWAVFHLGYLRGRRPLRSHSPLILILLGCAALAVAGVSVLLGETTIGHGVAIRAIEPQRFWQLVGLQSGAGCVLVLLGLFGAFRGR